MFFLQGHIYSQLDPSRAHPVLIASSDNAVITHKSAGLYANPATSLIGVSKGHMTAAFLRRYDTDLRSANAAITWRVGSDGLGFFINSYGIEGFRLTTLAASYTKSIGDKAYLSVQPKLSSIQIEDLGQRSQLDLTIGYWQEISDEWSWSVHIDQARSLLSTSSLQQLGIAQIGISYLLSDKAALYQSISYTSDGRWSYSPGLRYSPQNKLDLFISLSTAPSTFAAGIDLDLTSDLSLQLGYNSHPQLGSSLSVSVGYLIES